KLQQSLGLVHEPPAVLHIGCVHRCVVVSHWFEQHSLFAAQFTPPAEQVGPPPALRSSPPPTLISVPVPVSSLWQPTKVRRPIARLICNARMTVLRPAHNRDTGIR